MNIDKNLGKPNLPVAVSRWLFLRKFLHQGTRVASIAPSSHNLALALCQHITPKRPQTIVELGAGTGAVTAVAVQKMHPQSTFVAVELDRDFARILRQRFPRLTVLEANVSNLSSLLVALGIGSVDVVLSGLPTPSLPRSVSTPLFTCLNQQLGVGYLSQLTLLPWVYAGFYRRLFAEVAFSPVWRNLPPGGVYHCRRVSTDFAKHLPGF